MLQLELIPSIDEYWAFSPVLGDTEDPMLFRLEEQVLQRIEDINQLKSELRRLLSYRTEESREVQQKILETEDLEASGREIISSLLHGYQTIQDALIANRRNPPPLHYPARPRRLGIDRISGQDATPHVL